MLLFIYLTKRVNLKNAKLNRFNSLVLDSNTSTKIHFNDPINGHILNVNENEKNKQRKTKENLLFFQYSR